MSLPITIDSAIESVELLPPDDQMMVVEIIRNRLIEQRRNDLAESVMISREEYKAGKTGKGSVDDFLQEIENE